jgi:Ca2+-binding EF-hand superfamily protein
MKLAEKSKLLGLLLMGGALLAGTGAALADRGRGMPAMHDAAGMMRADEQFAAADADGDGRITTEEMAAHRAARFAEMDANGDGQVSRDEIVAAAVARMTEALGRRADAMIAAQDADGNGTLGATEMGRIDMGMQMFQRLDRDGDGAVSQDELRARGAWMEGRGRDGASGRHWHDRQGRDEGRRWDGRRDGQRMGPQMQRGTDR